MKSTYLIPLASAAMLFACASSYAQSPSGVPSDRAAIGQELAGTRSDDEGREQGRHGDFDKWDTNKRGYLTSDDVKGDEWLRKNFDRCNEARDGHMRREEFARCHE